MSAKVLCAVEDDPDMRLLIRAALRRDSRLQVNGEADNLDEALERVRTLQPDLVILDHFIHGQVMGLQAAPIIRAASPGTKILLFTSHDLTVEVAKEPAIDGYLRKGEIAQLLHVVQALLGIDEPEPVDAVGKP